jgi:hypothetical protein
MLTTQLDFPALDFREWRDKSDRVYALLSGGQDPELVDAYGLAERSECNRDAKRIGQRLAAIALEIDRWCDTHDDECRCDFCTFCGESEAPHIRETLTGAVWAMRAAVTVIDCNVIGTF